jgi:hypothetical protein
MTGIDRSVAVFRGKEIEPQMNADERRWSACTTFGLALNQGCFSPHQRSSAFIRGSISSNAGQRRWR